MAIATRTRLKRIGLCAGVVALLMLPSAASAFFPPFYNYPYPQPVQNTPVATPAGDPAPAVPAVEPFVDPFGMPDVLVDVPVVDTPVAQTPEPATLVSGLIGLGLLAGWSRNRRRHAAA